jgi:hypothetical protein
LRGIVLDGAHLESVDQLLFALELLLHRLHHSRRCHRGLLNNLLLLLLLLLLHQLPRQVQHHLADLLEFTHGIRPRLLILLQD